MKRPFKIQNRTDTSRRVKFVKNGGSVNFPNAPTSSFIENSREAGFCLTAINPLPERQNATSSITLTSHPMGTDGRVSLFINDVLVESKRFTNLARVNHRQAWFNSEFGAYVNYSGKEKAVFTAVLVSQDTYRFVFEDDDLDYQFADLANAPGDINPTLIVEQYRLAFNLINNTIQISCEGATYETPFMVMEGDWRLEINGVTYTTEDTSIDEMLDIIAAHDIRVVYEGEEEITPAPTQMPVTDHTLYGWYNSELGRFEGFYRPDNTSLVLQLKDKSSEDYFYETPVADGQGRWYLDYPDVSNLVYMDISSYIGDLNDMDNMIWVDYWIVRDFTVMPLDRSGQADIIPTHSRSSKMEGTYNLFYKGEDGQLKSVSRNMSTYYPPSDEVSLSEVMVDFTEPRPDEGDLWEFALLLQTYTNVLALNRYYTVATNDITALTPREGTIPLEKPKRITFYRGMKEGTKDLFELLFPDAVGNSVTLTATARADFIRYSHLTSVFAVTEGEILQKGITPDGQYFVSIDTRDLSNIKSKMIPVETLVTPLDSSYRYDLNVYDEWKMVFTPDGKHLIISLIKSQGDHTYTLMLVYRRDEHGVYTRMGKFEENIPIFAYPEIIDDRLVYMATDGHMYDRILDEASKLYIPYNIYPLSGSWDRAVSITPYTKFGVSQWWDWRTGLTKWVFSRNVYNPTAGEVVTYTSPDAPNGPYSSFQSAKINFVQIDESTILYPAMDTLMLVDLGTTEDYLPRVTAAPDFSSVSTVIKLSENEEEIFAIVSYRNHSAAMIAINRSTKAIRTVQTYTAPDWYGDYGYRVENNVVIFFYSNNVTTDMYFVRFDVTTSEYTLLPYTDIRQQ